VCLILIVPLDVFLTVLYAHTGIIGNKLPRLTWRLLLGLAKLSGPQSSATVLSFCGTWRVPVFAGPD
jgi:hypothetical protein